MIEFGKINKAIARGAEKEGFSGPLGFDDPKLNNAPVLGQLARSLDAGVRFGVGLPHGIVELGDQVGGSSGRRLVRDLVAMPTAFAGGAISHFDELGTLARQLLPRLYGSKMLYSRSTGYETPKGVTRAFNEDYPNGARSENGRLTHDIDGRPLNPNVILAGRQQLGGESVAVSHGQFDTLGESLTGRATQASSLPRHTLGRVTSSGTTKRPLGIELSDRLSGDDYYRVYAHELGHAIDQAAGEIPTKGLSKELTAIYNTLNNPQNYGKPFTPKHAGYKGEDVAREQMAEAIRAYMENPDYLKSVAPNVAVRIRKYVNSSPNLSKIIQFNSAAGAAYLGAEGEE